MRYRVFNGQAIEFHVGDPVPNLRYTGQAVVVLDPSKTNCALVVGDPGGEIQIIVEMTGNNWRVGPVMDTTQYCSEVKDFIRRLLVDTEVYMFKAEQAITKKGMNHHHSSMVLTEIRAALLGLAYEEYGFHKEQVEVNNWSWKHGILPEGYRSQNEKGSFRYFWQYLKDDTYLDYFEADVTDCVCIYQFVIKNIKDTYRIVCTQKEKARKEYKLAIMPSYVDTGDYRPFTYNPSFTVEENAAYFVNHSRRSGIAEMKIPFIPMESIYRLSSGFMKVPKENVRLVVAI